MNYLLELSYDGSRYNGWQRLGNTENTIQGKVETALSRLLDQPIEICAAGRTDAGVHARCQICSFRADTDRAAADILADLRHYLPADIGAIRLEEAPDRFHARYNCRGKTYIYRIWTSEVPNVFDRKYLTVFTEPLDMEEMRRAADLLSGTHDFSAFCSAKSKAKSAVRTIFSIEIHQEGGELRLSFRGDGFLTNMVRILTGTLLEVGTGKRSAEEIPAIFASGKRAEAGFTAPPGGLILWDLEYDNKLL